MSHQYSIRDWKVEFVAPKHYAIFHKVWNLEWADEQGDNLHFETAKEAREYLKKVNEGETSA